MARMVRNRIQSVFSFAMRPPASHILGIHARRPLPDGRGSVLSCQLPNQPLEFAAAMFVILKLIEAGAGGGEEAGLAAGRLLVRLANRNVDGSATLHWKRAAQVLFDLLRGRADEQRRATFFA